MKNYYVTKVALDNEIGEELNHYYRVIQITPFFSECLLRYRRQLLWPRRW